MARLGRADAGAETSVLSSDGDRSHLAKTDAHLPTAAGVANRETDAPVRFVGMVVRNAKAALEEAQWELGKEVPMPENPPPRACFRGAGDRLWVRVVKYGQHGSQLTAKQLAAVQAVVFGTTPDERDYREDVQGDSFYLVGPIPSMDRLAPPERLL